jgi:hypothetical protein
VFSVSFAPSLQCGFQMLMNGRIDRDHPSLLAHSDGLAFKGTAN